MCDWPRAFRVDTVGGLLDLFVERCRAIGDWVSGGGEGIEGIEFCGEDALETEALWSRLRSSRLSPSSLRLNPKPLSSPSRMGRDMGTGARPRITSLALPLSADSDELTRPSASLVIMRCRLASLRESASCSSAARSLASCSSSESLSSDENGEGGRTGLLAYVPWRVEVEQEVVFLHFTVDWEGL